MTHTIMRTDGPEPFRCVRRVGQCLRRTPGMIPTHDPAAASMMQLGYAARVRDCWLSLCFVTFSAAAAGAAAQDPIPAERPPARTPDIQFVPTRQGIVDAMLRLASVGPDDVVYDLGSGDGRIVIIAAEKYGARGVGIELVPRLVEMSRELAREGGVAGSRHLHRRRLVYGRHLGGHGRDAVSLAEHQQATASETQERAPARHADRVPPVPIRIVGARRDSPGRGWNGSVPVDGAAPLRRDCRSAESQRPSPRFAVTPGMGRRTDRHLGAVPQRLQHDAITLGQLNQLGDGIGRCIRLQVEAQPDAVEADGCLARHAERAAEIQVAFGRHATAAYVDAHRGRDGPSVTPAHAASACSSMSPEHAWLPVAAGGRVQSGLHGADVRAHTTRPARCRVDGPCCPQGELCGGRFSPVARLERRLRGADLVCVHAGERIPEFGVARAGAGIMFWRLRPRPRVTVRRTVWPRRGLAAVRRPCDAARTRRVALDAPAFLQRTGIDGIEPELVQQMGHGGLRSASSPAMTRARRLGEPGGCPCVVSSAA